MVANEARPAVVPSPEPSARRDVTPDAASPAEGHGDTVTRVAATWAEVLRTPDIPTEINFFDLGSHSLAMFRLQDALESHTGVRPSVVELFRHTTVAAQVAVIRKGGDWGDWGRLAHGEQPSGKGHSGSGGNA